MQGLGIEEFYRGKVILLTGGTGFLGKVTIEKLLRSLDIEAIFLIIRDKKGKNLSERVAEMFDDVLYGQLKKERPDFLGKLLPLNGDTTLPRLGLSSEDYETVINRTNIVLHLAANVKLDETFKNSIMSNAFAAREIVDLVTNIKSLTSFMFVSTAFSNSNQLLAEEKFYKPGMLMENAIKLAETDDDELLKVLTPRIIENWPNTYVFSKNMAEDYIRRKCSGLPVGIYRPALVCSTYKEPIIGWINNLYGPIGITVGTALGVLRVVRAGGNISMEAVPVDYCVNALLASTLEIAKTKFEEPKVYNFATHPENKTTYEIYMNHCFKHGSSFPTNKAIWYHRLTLEPNLFIYEFYKIAYHVIPAIFIDSLRLIIGKKPKMLQAYRKIHRFIDSTAFFSLNNWNFPINNVQKLWTRMSESEQETFYYDMKTLNWEEYMANSLFGMRTYITKEDPITIPIAKVRLRRMKILHYTVIYGFYIICFFAVYWFVFLKILKI